MHVSGRLILYGSVSLTAGGAAGLAAGEAEAAAGGDGGAAFAGARVEGGVAVGDSVGLAVPVGGAVPKICP